MLSLRTLNGVEVAQQIGRASTFKARALGLLVRSRLSAREGLMFEPGGSIHTFGMRFSIDVLFLSHELQVLRIASHVKPWRVRSAPLRTQITIELHAGASASAALAVGDRLLLVASVDTANGVA